MIYLASPYSHAKAEVQQSRYDAVVAYATELIAKGVHVISPIMHWHYPAAIHDLPGDAQHWKDWNEDLLCICKQLHVLCLEGWEQSSGVQHEIKLAKFFEYPIFYLTPCPSTSPTVIT